MTMPQYISPGVYTVEKDLSQYVSNLSTTLVAMVGTSDIGPSQTPTLVTSASQYVNLFGQPSPNHYLGYAALSYLEQGHQLYVTRVSPSDSATAKLTVPVPATATPYAGIWTLASNTDSSATFTISNNAAATGANKLVILAAADTSVTLKNFDFTDSSGIAPIYTTAGGPKLGADLNSFIHADSVNKTKVNSYVVGRSFNVLTGSGKGTPVPITNLTTKVVDTSLSLTVDASKFNPFNSPILTPATGSLTSQVRALVPTVAIPSLAVIGATNGATAGTVTLAFPATSAGSTVAASDVVLAALVSAPLVTLETLVTANNTSGEVSGVAAYSVVINVPLYTDGTTISAPNAAKNATLIAAILNTLVDAFRLGAAGLAGKTNLLAANVLCGSTSLAGITGVGSYNATTGVSQGFKSAAVQTDGVTVVLAAITLGASGLFSYTGVHATLVASNMSISGTFDLNLFRPTWVTSTAGSSTIPTLMKFSSKGQTDLSNVAVTVGLNSSSVDSNNEQLYDVSLFLRNTGLTISTSSTNQSDFALIEKYTGTIQTLQSTISANSAYVTLRVDYASEDLALLQSNYFTGTPVSAGDWLTPSFALFSDLAGTGAVSGTLNKMSGSTRVPSFSAFLQGGFAGSAISKYDIIGDQASKTGIYSVADAEALDINLLVAPGWSADPDVAKYMIDLCATLRGDCMCILDTPFGLSVREAIKYRNNILMSGSNYAALYYPWVQIDDTVNKIKIFVPPSGMVAAQYAYNDSVGAVYTAPAGRNRGNLLTALATERVLNQGDRDALALAQVNPIYTEAGYGIYIRGQMTLQSLTTALNRVNVRRLFLNLRKVISTASKYFEFEPGDAITALRLKQLAESTLTQRLNQGAIRSFTVDVGPDINTSQVLENNQLQMVISVVPTKTAEVIIEVFNILPQGQGISIANS